MKSFPFSRKVHANQYAANKWELFLEKFWFAMISKFKTFLNLSKEEIKFMDFLELMSEKWIPAFQKQHKLTNFIHANIMFAKQMWNHWNHPFRYTIWVKSTAQFPFTFINVERTYKKCISKEFKKFHISYPIRWVHLIFWLNILLNYSKLHFILWVTTFNREITYFNKRNW